MSYRWSIAVAAVFMLGGTGIAAAEMPIYEVMGLPITPHQLVVTGPAGAEQDLTVVTPTVAGMPASPHQVAVLTPRQIEGSSEQRHAQILPIVTIGQVQ